MSFNPVLLRPRNSCPFTFLPLVSKCSYNEMPSTEDEKWELLWRRTLLVRIKHNFLTKCNLYKNSLKRFKTPTPNVYHYILSTYFAKDTILVRYKDQFVNCLYGNTRWTLRSSEYNAVSLGECFPAFQGTTFLRNPGHTHPGTKRHST